MTNTADIRIVVNTAVRQGLRVRLVYKDGRGHEAVTPLRCHDIDSRYIVVADGKGGSEIRDTRIIESAELIYLTAMREGQ